MIKIEEEFNTLHNYQKLYGKRRGIESRASWILRKRTINVACMVISRIKDMEFSQFELALYIRCDSPELMAFLRRYEFQMEESFLNPSHFVKELNSFFLEMIHKIEEEQLYREFFDFCEIMGQMRSRKIKQGHKKLFDAFISLLMQQAAYFTRYHMEDSIAGIKTSGEPIFCTNKHPYSDLPAYMVENQLQSIKKKQADLSKELNNAYKGLGYDINSFEEAEYLDAMVRVYDNNNYTMIPYIDENSLDMRVDEPFQHKEAEFPRIWKDSTIYREKLKHRNYMLPVPGVQVCYRNAASKHHIIFKNKVFCLPMPLVTVCIFKYTEEILAFCIIKPYKYMQHGKKLKLHSGIRHYQKELYQEELRSRSGYIRSLPINQQASAEAKQLARDLGYELPNGKTFVRAHEFHAHCRMHEL